MGKGKAKAAIFIISIIFQSMNSVALVISGVAKEFPDASTTSVQLVYTLMSLMSIAGMLVAGKLVNVMTKKKLVILFNVLLLIGGLIGYFGTINMPMVYVASIFIGIGNGAIMPVMSAVIAENFQGGERASMNGLQSLFVCGGGLIFNLVGGMLASQNWRSLYFIFLFALPVIICTMILLPEGPVEKKEEGVRVKLFTPLLISLSLQSLIFGIGWATFYANVTYYIFDLGIGNESQAGLVTVAFSIGSIIMGLILRFVMKWSGKYCFAMALIISAVGLWCMYFANNLVLLTIGGILLGAGFGLFMPSGYTLIPSNVQPAAITMSISIFTACFAFGGFLNPYIVTLSAGAFSDAISARFLVAAIILVIDVVFCFITTLKMKSAQTVLE